MGAIAHFTGYEVGYVAWGIGALVGFLSAKAGGEGMPNGAICAVITIAALLAGKFVAFKMTFDVELKALLEPSYEVQKTEAEQFATLDSKDDWRAFVFANDYSESPTVEGVTEDELQGFEEMTVPLFEKLNQGMTYDDYQSFVMGESGGMMGAFKESFGAMDILFFVLGIITAFKIGAGDGEEGVGVDS